MNDGARAQDAGECHHDGGDGNDGNGDGEIQDEMNGGGD